MHSRLNLQNSLKKINRTIVKLSPLITTIFTIHLNLKTEANYLWEVNLLRLILMPDKWLYLRLY